MNAGQLRRTLRAGHIVVGVLLSIYVYSPLHADPLLTDIIRYLAIPDRLARCRDVAAGPRFSMDCSAFNCRRPRITLQCSV
jgi:hypothetical protein